MTKAEKNQPEILNIYAFCQKIQRGTLGPGGSTAAVTDLSIRIHPKSYLIFSLKVAATLLSDSRKGAVGG